MPAFFAELIEEVLEGNGCQRLALTSVHSRALLPRSPDGDHRNNGVPA